MPANPYKPPAVIHGLVDSILPNRRPALTAFRIAFFVLLAPALFNYYAFDTHMIGQPIPPNLRFTYRASNLVAFASGSVFIWLFAFPLLEAASRVIRSVVARDVSIDRWYDALYLSLKRAVPLALSGAVLWAVWVVGFYYLQLDFVLISWGVGVPAHVLAACLYVPLLLRWYRLARGRLTEEEQSDNS